MHSSSLHTHVFIVIDHHAYSHVFLYSFSPCALRFRSGLALVVEVGRNERWGGPHDVDPVGAGRPQLDTNQKTKQNTKNKTPGRGRQGPKLSFFRFMAHMSR